MDKKPQEGLQKFRQALSGRRLAFEAAVHALIRSHPDPNALSKALTESTAEFEDVMSKREVLQQDDGMRSAFSGTIRELRSLLPDR